MLTTIQYESCNNQIADALDAYGRAAELDPTNVHIKARLQLLQNQLSGSNQNNAPLPKPQDVHPQAYQAPGVGAPPPPQWGAHAPAGGPPHAPRQVTDWNRGVTEIQAHAPAQVPVQAANGYDNREAVRGPAIVQQPSPHQEQAMMYADSVRGQQAARSPKASIAGPAVYAPAGLPQLANHPAAAHERGPSGPNAFPGRGPLPPGASAPVAGAPNGAPAAGPMPPYHRPFTPPAKITPIRDERPPSPHSTYPHQQYHPGPSVPVPGSSGIAGGAPPPASAMAAAEMAAREREDRPASAMKRAREWEAESGPAKKIASEENRARLDEQVSRTVTPPNRMPSPAEAQRRNSSEAKREEQRASESYHPSEAAHHPPTLPSIQHMPPHPPGSNFPPMGEGSTSGPPSGPPSAQTPVKEESARADQPQSQEPAARKMDVDEDYDDDDDEKKTRAAGGSPSGSVNASNGVDGGNQTPQSKQE